MLGGDSINKNGGIQYFTKKQAKILAYEVLTLQKKNPSFLLITNGPRTGKYNEKTDKKTTANSKSKIHKTCDIDEISKTFRDLSKTLNLTNTDFIRTTEERHKKAVQYLWNELQKNDDIYLSKYSGWYSVSDEAFYNEDEIEYQPEYFER